MLYVFVIWIVTAVLLYVVQYKVFYNMEIEKNKFEGKDVKELADIASKKAIKYALIESIVIVLITRIIPMVMNYLF